MEEVSHSHSAKGAGGGQVPDLPRQLEPVRRQTLERLNRALATMLDQADDRLFDMAEGASEEDRDRYFETMRQLRLQRSGLESGFKQELEKLFRVLATKGRQGDDEESLVDQEVDIDSLALVEDDEVEADVALENMARRARSDCEEDLRLFNHRVEYLYESRLEVNERTSPLDPRQIAGCFQKNLQKMELNLQDRLVLMKLFERSVLAELATLVANANRELSLAGVLPDLKKAPVKPGREPKSQRPETPESEPDVESMPQGDGQDGAEDSDNPPVFGMLRNLLGEMRGPGGGAPGVPPVGGPTPENIAVMHDGVPYVNGVPASKDDVQEVPSDDLMSMLSRMQQLEQQLKQTEGKLEELNVKQELSGLLEEQYGKKSVHALEEADDDVINLVAMLFDFILEDESLPAEVRALIGRLQIPLLKVAIADKTFFNDDSHPARELLNLLARAGSQWSPEQGLQDDLYRSIEESVYRILNDFDTDASLFRELLQSMESSLEEQEQRRDRVEERVREQEEGKARADEAQRRVREFIDKRLAGRDLPEAVVHIARGAWEQVLYLTWLREGEDSELWKKRARVLDALVWSVLPHEDAQSLIKLKSLSPKLLSSLKQGLEAVNHDAMDTRQLLLDLRHEHQQILTGEHIDRIHIETADDPDEVSKDALPADHPCVKQAMELQPGQWLEIGLGEGARRCKLAANIRGGSKLIFINRRGLKVVEHDAQSLGMALDQGVARLIDEGALFDRALEAVIGDLRRQQGEHSASAEH